MADRDGGRDKAGFDNNAPRIEDVISEAFSDVPESEWARVPTDLSRRLDYYIHGIDRE